MMFSKEKENFQVAWDSTSLGLFKQCPRKYYYSIVLGYRGGVNAALAFGIIYHKIIENHLKRLALETPFEESLRAVVRDAVSMAPQIPPGDTKRGPVQLLRAAVWYCEHYRSNALSTEVLQDGTPAVELSFKFDSGIKANTGEEIILCGHLDRVADFDGQLWAVDLKTTGSSLSDFYFDNYSPDNQVTLYTIATKIILSRPAKGVIIDGVQLQVGSNHFRRGFAHRTEEHCVEWLDELPYWVALAELSAERSLWPQNDKSCFWCDFKKVCSANPSHRLRLLEEQYSKERWNPLEVR